MRQPRMGTEFFDYSSGYDFFKQRLFVLEARGLWMKNILEKFFRSFVREIMHALLDNRFGARTIAGNQHKKESWAHESQEFDSQRIDL